MIEITFNFPVKSDAYLARKKAADIFQGSKSTETNVTVTQVHKLDENPDRPIWGFRLYFKADENDTEIDTRHVFTGGMLDLVNKDRRVWAFA